MKFRKLPSIVRRYARIRKKAGEPIKIAIYKAWITYGLATYHHHNKLLWQHFKEHIS